MDFIKSYWPQFKLPKRSRLNVCQRISGSFGLDTLKHWPTTNSGATVPTVSIGVQSENLHPVAQPPCKEWKYDPKRDNYGLYALKCDRSAAKKGLVLNIPCPKLVSAQRRISPEMTHEKFEPVDNKQLQPENSLKAPPRRKRKSLAGASAEEDNLFGYTKPNLSHKEQIHPSLTALKQEMARPFERQASVDIFAQLTEKPFDDFDQIFGPSPPQNPADHPVERKLCDLFDLSKSIQGMEVGQVEERSRGRPRDQLTISKLYSNEDVLEWTF